MQFFNDNALLTIADNQITIQEGDEALTATAPIWAAEILKADKPSLKDVDFSERSQPLLYRLLKYAEKTRPTPPQFNPVAIRCPNRHVLQFHDNGRIDLFSNCGKRVSFVHKPLINAQVARARGYRVCKND